MSSTVIDMLNGVNSSTAVKSPVRAVATANVATLSGFIEITTSSGTITVAADDRIGLSAQTDPVQNGVYDITSTGAWQRSPDFDGVDDVKDGTRFYTEDGEEWRVNGTDPIQPGSSEIELINQTDLDEASLQFYVDEAADYAQQSMDASAAAIAAITGTQIEEQSTATEGQTVIITDSSYVVGANNLAVYIDGVRLYKTLDYVETDENTITLNVGLTAGNKILVVAGEGVGTYRISGLSVQYIPAGSGAVPTTVQDKLRETVSVKDFGAVGDGVTDDTAAIQAAATFALSAGIGLYFGSGTYLIDGSVTFTDANGFRIYGEGASSIIKKGSTATSPRAFAFSSTATNVEIDHLRFYSDRTLANTDTGLIDGSNSSVTIDGLYIHDNIFNLADDGVCAMLFASASSKTIKRIKILGNLFNSVKYAAIAFNNHNSDSIFRISDIIVADNTFKDVGLFCNTFSGTMSNIVVSNNNFTGTNGVGVELVSGCHGVNISDNTYEGTLSQILSMSGSAPYPGNANVNYCDNVTKGTVTASWTLQCCSSFFMQGNKLDTSGALQFNGVGLGVTAHVINNWLSSALSTSNGGVLTKFNNYIGTTLPENIPNFSKLTLSGGDATSTAVVTLPFASSWSPAAIRVKIAEVVASGSAGSYVESVFAVRHLNSTTTVLIARTDIVTHAGMALTISYGSNNVTITATSTASNSQHVWSIEVLNHLGVNVNTIVFSA